MRGLARVLMPFSLASHGARAGRQGVDWYQRCARHDTQSVLPQRLELSLIVKSIRRGTDRCAEPNKREQHRRGERPGDTCSGPSHPPVTGPPKGERSHPSCCPFTDTKNPPSLHPPP